ncbi:MAG TPA: sodium:proton antiporter [Acidilobales archaeon]|nr:MAG: sodium:proton antiporter [Desulfurococcales archaeon ex4484_42]HDD25691.1 sodium:proton antiporter [Acidilobales archaeon]
MRKEDIALILLMAAIALIAYLVAYYGITGPYPFYQLRTLGAVYIYVTLLKQSGLWAASPEAVTAILWDYRGLDTVFETSVFFLAIISAVALFRLTPKYEKEYKELGKKVKDTGLSLIVKLITKIVLVMIIAISASIALHGQLTPGGGFQGGSALAVAPILLIIGFSVWYVEKLGFTKTRALTLRTIGLVTITLIALIPIIYSLITMSGAYILQNQPKPGAPFSYPERVLGVFSGSLLFLNIAEYLAVANGFLVTFILLAIPEVIYFKIIKEERGGE